MEPNIKNRLFYTSLLIIISLALMKCSSNNNSLGVSINKGSHVILIGNNLCSRMMNYGHFETELQLRYPDSLLYIRNMCDGGDTPGFRPHSGRPDPWAFPGAEKFQTELTNPSGSIGHVEYPDEWLSRHKADIILAFFGYNESFEGKDGLENYKNELQSFIQHTQQQKYNASTAPQLILISPIAFQNLSDKMDLPDGKKENANLLLYTNAMKEVANKNAVPFVDVFTPTKKWFDTNEAMTIDGFQMTDAAYQKFAKFISDQIFGQSKISTEANRTLVHQAVQEKNWFWHYDYKAPNGVHVFGRRYEPFGPDNYPDEILKVREMTAIRDQAIWAAVKGEQMDLKKADQSTTKLSAVNTNFKPTKKSDLNYQNGESTLNQFKMASGYNVELFASEEQFADLANPVQLSFDNRGRLWVAVMPSYPHYKPGDPKPNDKLIILEDTDGDNKADKQTTFAENLHLPIGFEFAPEGVYVSQGTNLILLTDTNGDDKADKKEIILSGFDDHDTHHAISAFCADPSGAIYMGEGIFLHTNVETPYGVVHATDGGFYRYSPQRHHLERTAQIGIPNPWGIAFDDWGQNFYAETSGPVVSWMMPGSIKPTYGQDNPKSRQLIEPEHEVRPTSGLEFISSRHFPDEVQGDLIINNTIGFLGTKQHKFEEDGTGYKSSHRQDLIRGSDKNFRPVDMEFAPDGSLYLADWHNILIGHMQHNARDPLRDHAHGRIYRITYPSRPLVTPAKVAGASIETLLDNLKLPEYRTRYRTRRELRARNTKEVLIALNNWTKNLDQEDSEYEHHLLEALWVTWGLNQIDETLLRRMLESKDHRARAAAVKVLRFAAHQIKDQKELLLKAAQDAHGRVRLEALVAASWFTKEEAMPIVQAVGKAPLDDWMLSTYAATIDRINGKASTGKQTEEAVNTHLQGADRVAFVKGMEIYNRDGFCSTCHQKNGKGLEASGYPPIVATDWMIGDEERLIKLSLNGLMGPIEVNGKKYEGNVPMTPFGGLLNDEEMAAVLTYARNAFGNKASVITAEKVKAVREATKGKQGFYTPEELLVAQ